MRSLFLVLVPAGLAVGCATDGVVVVHSGPRYAPPSAIYMYADGSCWADDRMHAPCPWTFGGSAGYYAVWEGRYYWYGHRNWVDRRAPPPRAWRTSPPARHHWRHVPPPRLRHAAPPAPAHPHHRGWRGHPR